jgi:hypothetical protein
MKKIRYYLLLMIAVIFCNACENCKDCKATIHEHHKRDTSNVSGVYLYIEFDTSYATPEGELCEQYLEEVEKYPKRILPQQKELWKKDPVTKKPMYEFVDVKEEWHCN